jgi:hypothetical protein
VAVVLGLLYVGSGHLRYKLLTTNRPTMTQTLLVYLGKICLDLLGMTNHDWRRYSHKIVALWSEETNESMKCKKQTKGSKDMIE